MNLKKTTGCMLLMLSCIAAAEEVDIKKLYTDLTTAIHSSLLTRQSSVEVTGFLSFDQTQTVFDDDESLTSRIFLAEPAVSYFFVDNLSFGLCLSYTHQEIEHSQNGRSEASGQACIGPVVKYYFGSKRIRPFICADYLFLNGDQYEGGEPGLGAGLLVHAAGNFGFSLRIKYAQILSDTQGIDRQNRILISLGISNFIL